MTVQDASDSTALSRFLAHCHRRRYPAGATIVFQGDRPDTLFHVLKGSVAVLQEEEEGRTLVLAYLNPGDFFGELGMFQQDEGRSAWIRTRTACELAEMNYPQFRKLASDDPDILFLLASQMAVRLRATSSKAGDLAFLDVSGRTARTLLELTAQPDAITHPDGMQVRITRQELGRIVGCSREMVGRVLKEMVLQGLISTEGRAIVVFGTR